MANPKENERNNREDEELLKRLEGHLERIEADEILKGLTKEELEQRGFIGDKKIDVSRRIFTETTEREKLCFKEGVEYERLPDHEIYEKVDIDKLILVKDVLPQAVIATREPGETIPFQAGHNVIKEVSDAGEKYIAGVKGKIIIIKDTMHVVPSDIDCEIKIRISNDKMTAFLDCKNGYGDGKHLSKELVFDQINKLGIVYGIQIANIEKAINDAEKLQVPQAKVVIAEGMPPAPGADSAVDYFFSKDEDARTFKILPDGRIDYKGSANILIAKKGQLLATVKEAANGITGADIFGQVIGAEKGKEGFLVAGANVRASEDGKSFYAEISGGIVLNPPVLEVLELYEVRGDVDYSTGSIDFNGNVVINGSVREGFEVKADGDIIIQNCVEAAKIIAGRDVRISGGIIGHGKGLVSAGRDIYAEYVQNAKMEAQGTVYINDFAVNSAVFCNHLQMLKKHGSVIGGEVFAQRGIEVTSLGSQSGVKTYINAGTDYLISRKIKELDDVIRFYNENIKKIDGTLKPVLTHIKENPDSTKFNNSIIKSTLRKRKEMVSVVRIMEAKRKHLYEEQLEIAGVSFIKVKHACFADVYLTIKNLKMANSTIREHVRFYEDKKEGVIKTGAY